jgi:fructose-1-phosphate kinase PfkB-like protein
VIITVTLNAAIDKSLSVPNFRLGRRHRTVEQQTLAGGKGVNVARTLKTLGAPVNADRRAAHRGVDPQRLRPHP